ncbi:MAG: ribonuclease P [Methanolinea sp.]|nr:ribonuclease P [Methanolinea sp.]
MHCTDACVYPYPDGDSTIRRIALTARELGLDSVVVPGAVPQSFRGVEIVGAVFYRKSHPGSGRVPNGTQGAGWVLALAQAGEYAANRALLRSGNGMVLRGLHATPKNSFDHILSRIAAEKGIAVDIDFSPVIKERGSPRQRALQKYADVIRLHRKFDFPLTVSTGARSVLEMRSPREMAALGRLIGLERQETQEALATVGRLLFPGKAVEVVG